MLAVPALMWTSSFFAMVKFLHAHWTAGAGEDSLGGTVNPGACEK
jgi:hypothetical protein